MPGTIVSALFCSFIALWLFLRPCAVLGAARFAAARRTSPYTPPPLPLIQYTQQKLRAEFAVEPVENRGVDVAFEFKFDDKCGIFD